MFSIKPLSKFNQLKVKDLENSSQGTERNLRLVGDPLPPKSTNFASGRVLILVTFLLLGVSLLMIYSTTAQPSLESHSSSFQASKKHFVYILLGLVCFSISSRVNPDFIKKIAPFAFLGCFFTLAALQIPGIGEVAGGSRRWVSLGPIRFQPGEVMKLAFVCYMASYISRQHSFMKNFRAGIVVPALLMAAVVPLLLMQPDFGSSAIIAGVLFIQLFLFSNLFYLTGLSILGVLLALGLIVSSPYRMRRVEAFLSPLEHASDSGYQLVQSLVAISSGGIFGQGLGAGQQKLYYLPAAHTDFIFSIIAEELGFFGCFLVISLFSAIAYQGFRLVLFFKNDPFFSSLALGLTMLIVLPAILNIGVVSGLLPTKGLVLPLIAFGGTAMVVNLTVMGLLVSLTRQQYAR